MPYSSTRMLPRYRKQEWGYTWYTLTIWNTNTSFWDLHWLFYIRNTHSDQWMCIFKAQRQTWVTSGCNREAEPLPTQRTANLRQRQQRSTIRLSFWWAFNVSDNTGQIYNKEQRWSERNTFADKVLSFNTQVNIPLEWLSGRGVSVHSLL